MHRAESMTTTFEGDTALATGASGGIGRRIAERLAAAGRGAPASPSNPSLLNQPAAAPRHAAVFGADLARR